VLDGGQVRHLLAPAYHDDRIRGRGAVLVFRDYGRDITGRLVAAGFRSARIVTRYRQAFLGAGRLFPFPPSLLPGKLTQSLEVDDSAIRRALGWRPPFTPQEGLRATARWYRGR
jgi:nucleoside-diphosphate-sugar epimerase